MLKKSGLMETIAYLMDSLNFVKSIMTDETISDDT
jgi:hypothetical protein